MGDLLTRTELRRLFYATPGPCVSIFTLPARENQMRFHHLLRRAGQMGERFHLTPLLPLVSEDARFWILDVGRSRVQLIEASWSRAHGIDIAALPPLLDPADLLSILPRIQSRLAMLLDGDRAPLVVAAEDALFRVVQPTLTYAHVLEEHLPGDPDGASAGELNHRAWKVMSKYFRRSREREAARLRKLAGTSRRTDDIRIIVPAAFLGRVASLFVSARTEQWGTYDMSDFLVHVHEEPLPGDQDLAHVAAVITYISGGKVFVVKPGEMPDTAPLTAAFQ